MNTVFELLPDGRLTARSGGREIIAPSPAALLVKNGGTYAPRAALRKEDRLTLSFDCGDAVLSLRFSDSGLRLEAVSVPEGTKALVFGPYFVPGAESAGEILGAAWLPGGAAVCVQALNTKTLGGCPRLYGVSNETGFSLQTAAAEMRKGGACLMLGAADMSKPEILPEFSIDGHTVRNMEAEAVEGPDGLIPGAAVQVLAASSREELLSLIGETELKEGLPHPTIDGQWAKISPKASEIYFVMGQEGYEKGKPLIELAARAGVNCLYSGNPFSSWGHFGINTEIYPGGIEEFGRFSALARDRGETIGFHTLSNFITTEDAYVTPAPDDGLLVIDRTVLARPAGETDTEIFVSEKKNFSVSMPMNTLRVGNEIIKYGAFDENRLCLTGCVRGMFGTRAASHARGEAALRYWEHSYRTYLAGLKLQREMAARIGRFINETGARRMSFDGLEGCEYAGRGEYACAEFVKRVFDECGSELICDASTGSHYRWHAHSYFNWGEPWYDWDRRGGMFNLRASHMEYFDRNLLPRMLGWYRIAGCEGRFEGTLPETLESILARSIGFDAGLCFCVDDPARPGANALTGEYMDTIALWACLRRLHILPEDIKALMRDKHTDWHLEKRENEFVLQKLAVTRYPLEFSDKPLVMESGTHAYTASEGSVLSRGRGVMHKANVVLDRTGCGPDALAGTLPVRLRLRVGTPKDGGTLSGLAFYTGYYGSSCLLSFDVTASGGDYLIYEGGLTLTHTDANFNPIETLTGAGEPLTQDARSLRAYTLHYTTDRPDFPIELTHIGTEAEYRFKG